MAILLVHLRRIILLLSIVYFGGAFVRKLLTDSRRANHIQQLRKSLPPKHLHFQMWAYIYTGYAYMVLVNYFSESHFTNIFELLTTST